MDWQNCKLISISLNNHKVYVIENKTGTIVGKFAYPQTMLPTSLSLNENQQKACLALKQENHGAICILNFDKMQSYQLPIEIPSPIQFAITPDFKKAYFVSNDSTLYFLDTSSLTLTPLAQSQDTTCAGIVVENEKIYTIWESGKEGILTVFSLDGTIIYEDKFSGIPTNICLKDSEIMITFTESDQYGEGVIFASENSLPIYLSVQLLHTPYTPHIYPCSITLNKQKDTAYIIHEDGGAISIVDTVNHIIQKTFSIGRSITNIHLLPDERFAIATSNMFADLSLLDLVNFKLIAISDSKQEFSNILSILP